MIDALHKIYKICIVLNFSMFFKCIVLEQNLHLESFSTSNGSKAYIFQLLTNVKEKAL